MIQMESRKFGTTHFFQRSVFHHVTVEFNIELAGDRGDFRTARLLYPLIEDNRIQHGDFHLLAPHDAVEHLRVNSSSKRCDSTVKRHLLVAVYCQFCRLVEQRAIEVTIRWKSQFTRSVGP